MRNTSLKKIYRDLRQNSSRVLLVVLSIMLATAALSTISSSFLVLKREMEANFLGTNPADATIWLVPPPEGENIIAILKRHPAVAEAELRQVIEGRAEVAPNQWQRLILSVVEDFQQLRINTFELETGKFPRKMGEIGIERSCVSVAQREIGESLKVSLENGTETSLTLCGTVHDPAEAPGWMHGEIFAYTSSASLNLLGIQSTKSAIKIKLKQSFSNRLLVQKEVWAIGQFLEKRGFKVLRSIVPPPATHPHDRQLKAILSILLTFSVAILILSGVLLANMMNGFLSRQTKQIGIMKAIGGRQVQIQDLYLAFIAFMLIFAVPLGWCLSFPAGRAFTQFISNQLNFKLLNTYPPFWVSVLQVLICLAIPLIFGMLPVRKAMRKTVLNAFNAGNFSTTMKSVFWLNLGRFMARPLLLTIRNTFRQKRRFWLTMSSLALGGAAFMASFNVQAAWKATIAAVESKQRYDIDVKLLEEVPLARFDTLIQNIHGIKNYEAWSCAKTYVKYGDGTESLRFELSAVPASAQFYAPVIETGRALQADTALNEVVATRSLIFLEPRLSVGDKLNLMIGQELVPCTLVGITYEADAEPTFYLSKTNYDQLQQTQGLASHFRINTTQKSPAQQSKTLLALEKELSNSAVTVGLTKEAQVLTQNFKDHFTIIVNMLLIIALFLAAVGFLGLSSTLSMNVLERLKEFGIMQAVGARSRQIAQLIMLEGFIISILSWILAILIALPISYGMDVVIGKVGLLKPLDFVVNWAALFAWLGIVLLVSFLLSLVPAYQANRVSVREVLGYE